MRKITFGEGPAKATHYRANVPVQTVPEVRIEYTDPDTGKRMYETICGRIFDADIYDRNFKFDRTKIKPKNYRDPRPKHAYKGGIEA